MTDFADQRYFWRRQSETNQIGYGFNLQNPNGFCSRREEAHICDFCFRTRNPIRIDPSFQVPTTKLNSVEHLLRFITRQNWNPHLCWRRKRRRTEVLFEWECKWTTVRRRWHFRRIRRRQWWTCSESTKLLTVWLGLLNLATEASLTNFTTSASRSLGSYFLINLLPPSYIFNVLRFLLTRFTFYILQRHWLCTCQWRNSTQGSWSATTRETGDSHCILCGTSFIVFLFIYFFNYDVHVCLRLLLFPPSHVDMSTKKWWMFASSYDGIADIYKGKFIFPCCCSSLSLTFKHSLAITW